MSTRWNGDYLEFEVFANECHSDDELRPANNIAPLSGQNVLDLMTNESPSAYLKNYELFPLVKSTDELLESTQRIINLLDAPHRTTGNSYTKGSKLGSVPNLEIREANKRISPHGSRFPMGIESKRRKDSYDNDDDRTLKRNAIEHDEERNEEEEEEEDADEDDIEANESIILYKIQHKLGHKKSYITIKSSQQQQQQQKSSSSSSSYYYNKKTYNY